MSCIVQLYHKYAGRKALLTVCYQGEITRTMPDGQRATAEPKLGIQIPVTIVNIREVYGREQVLIRPFRGIGSTWVEATERLVVVNEWPPETEPSEPEEDQPDENQADDNGTTD
ncbi:hypothetical protein LCGC14_2714460 [marine sediment metagenome]|uniref:Uncharacterized protein n=1 Tax=marine sediment metagenome TaxID=412755 RepID=A0A0F8ZBY9_9ZZZZ